MAQKFPLRTDTRKSCCWFQVRQISTRSTSIDSTTSKVNPLYHLSHNSTLPKSTHTYSCLRVPKFYMLSLYHSCFLHASPISPSLFSQHNDISVPVRTFVSKFVKFSVIFVSWAQIVNYSRRFILTDPQNYFLW
jgi:hypothetical protein